MQLKYLTLLAWIIVAATACTDGEAPWFVETMITSNTTDPVGDYTITTVVTDNVEVTSVKLYYQRGLQLARTEVALTPGDTADVWTAKIPGVSQTTRIFYYLEAKDSRGNSARDPALEPDLYSFWINIAPTPPRFVDAGMNDSHSVDVANEDGPTQADAAGVDAAIADVPTEDQSSSDGGPEDSSAINPDDAATLDSSSQDS